MRVPKPGELADRLVARGEAALDDVEILSLAVGLRPEKAQEVLDRVDGLFGLVEAEDELLNVPGVGSRRIARIRAAIELSKRVGRAEVRKGWRVEGNAPLIRHLRANYGSRRKNVFGAVFLSSKLYVIGEGTYNYLTATSTPYWIMRDAFIREAAKIVLFYLPKNGIPIFHEKHTVVWSKLRNACQGTDIELVDFLIIGADGKWQGFHRKGKGK